MDRIELASCDFEGLQREFLEKSLIGSNVYLKSNPQEVERFRDFVMENAPFDVVLDALNIALKGQRTDMRRSKQVRWKTCCVKELYAFQLLLLGLTSVQHYCCRVV